MILYPYLGFNQTNLKVDWDLGQHFTHLDALSVLSLSAVWILVVLVIICGLKILKKVLSNIQWCYSLNNSSYSQKNKKQISYITLVVPVALLIAVLVKVIYTNPGKVYLGLTSILMPDWKSLLSFPIWSRAIIDTLLSLNLGYGVITFLSSLSAKKVNSLR